MIRIIGGEHRRRQLQVLDRPGLRPTPDRVRETLFNWLAAVTPNARVLDLFAGSGVLGLEALSRGAAHVDFVEKDAAAARLLGQNIEQLRLGARCKLWQQDAQSFLQQEPAQPYHLVFLDPPYASELLAHVLPRLNNPEWLAADACIFIDQSAHGTPPAALSDGSLAWKKHREGRAGEVSYSLYLVQS